MMVFLKRKNLIYKYIQYSAGEKFPWGPFLSLKAGDDPQMSLQFPTITSFIRTVEDRHLQSKTEEGRFKSPKGIFHMPGLYLNYYFVFFQLKMTKSI